ncbi:MAG: alpha/beta fold hydrolase [Ruminococcaceae bacterium]|nr:alpha/beta fold hydrolase [Oscillospiraceae bacterium]
MARNFKPTVYWDSIASEHIPKMSFESCNESFEGWHKKALEKLKALMGELPEKVPLNAEIEFKQEDNGIIRERVVIDTEKYMSMPMYVIYPKDIKPDKSTPAILCCHGHGLFGKDCVAGIRSDEAHIADIESQNYNYGELMARHGYITFCPDLRGFGERNDRIDPFPGRDACNINFIKGALFDSYTLALNIFDMMRCIDYMQERAEVNADKIGIMGLSYGGTITTFTAALDERIKAADIICYVNSFEKFAINRANFCGAQILPGLYNYLDVSDIAGLIAPRPLLIEMGLYDDCFYIEDTKAGFEKVEKIYTAANAREKLFDDVCPVKHAFCNNKAYSFFDNCFNFNKKESIK